MEVNSFGVILIYIVAIAQPNLGGICDKKEDGAKKSVSIPSKAEIAAAETLSRFVVRVIKTPMEPTMGTIADPTKIGDANWSNAPMKDIVKHLTEFMEQQETLKIAERAGLTLNSVRLLYNTDRHFQGDIMSEWNKRRFRIQKPSLITFDILKDVVNLRYSRYGDIMEYDRSILKKLRFILEKNPVGYVAYVNSDEMETEEAKAEIDKLNPKKQSGNEGQETYAEVMRNQQARYTYAISVFHEYMKLKIKYPKLLVTDTIYY